MSSGDIIDYVTNNWSSILGLNPSQTSGTPAPSAVAPPPAEAFSPGAYSPSGVGDVNPLTAQPVTTAPTWPTQPNQTPYIDPMSGLPMPPPGPVSGAPAPAPAPAWPPTPPPAAVPNGAGYGGGPQPMPPPTAAPNGGAPPGSAMAAPVNGVPMSAPPPPLPPLQNGGGPGGGFSGPPPINTSTGPVAPVGPPLNISPNMGVSGAPPAPPPPNTNGPPTAATGNLANALGINPAVASAIPQVQQAPKPWQNMLTTGLAGLGKGLTATGNLRPGASAGQAFAAGAGGALEGGMAHIQQQKNDLFNQSSTAFRDMMLAQSTGNTEAYRKAQSTYLQARARQLQLTGNVAKDKTPYEKVIGVENEVSKYAEQQNKNMREAEKAFGWTPEKGDEERAKVKKDVEDYRTRMLKSAGVNPDEANKIKDAGKSADNPVDTEGLTMDQFNAHVPMGAWFKDGKGDVRQRTVGTSDTAPAAAPDSASTVAADRMALGRDEIE